MLIIRYCVVTFFSVIFTFSLRADEGMYPISDLQKINLKQKGLKIKITDIYNPNEVSLIHSIVSLGFCTGSFVSGQGLILTNHHCAFGAVQSASSVSNDYITEGFLARSMEDEVPAKDYTIRITESYRDVTEMIMQDVIDTMSALVRAQKISSNMKAVAEKARMENPDKQIEVAEMLPGKSYLMFVYTFLRDIRLVYVPPRAIGEFGGEDDNWMWPRHTGDFAFIRAYVSKDGKSATYSKDNIPYKPKKFLKIAASGITENEFVFVLGYPGRTYRHRPAEFVSYENEVRMPYLADMLEWQIRIMEVAGRNDHATAIMLAQRIKSLANSTKNFRGKLKSMKATGLTEKKRNEEKGLWDFIQQDKNRNVRYGQLSDQISSMFSQIRKQAEYEFVLDYMRRSVLLVDLGFGLIEAMHEMQKTNDSRRPVYRIENRPALVSHLRGKVINYHEPTDRLIFSDLMNRTQLLPAGFRFQYADRLIAGVSSDSLAESMYRRTLLNKDTAWTAYLKVTPDGISGLNDPFMQFINEYYQMVKQFDVVQEEQTAELNKLYADLIEVRSQYLQKNFIPDANRTLRFTFGYIRGYSPADALYCRPFTTMKGIIEKTKGTEPFDTPKKLIDLHKNRSYSKYKDKKLNDVPVAMLYNTDTTGGNSGSPVLNAKGEIVGLNFDRTFEATINDFAWDESYSRSIGVDVRYILWILDQYAGAKQILHEMNIE